ncbi:MAG: WD40 repeat domain-containing protein [Parachlamydiales bacterium]|nr:WD40 repeat domain-containing protein [Candidatus Acheromyda pituitae]
MSGFLKKLLPAKFQPNDHLNRAEPSTAQLYHQSLSRLPQDAIVELFIRLQLSQINLLGCTCRTYHQLSFQNDRLWELIFSKTFSTPLPNPLFRGCHLEAYKYQHAINMNLKNGVHTNQTLMGHHKGITCLISWDDMFATGSLDKTIRIWDSTTGKCVKELVGHDAPISCLAACNGMIISGSFDHTIKIWDLESGQCQSTIREDSHAIRSILIDNGMILSGSFASDINVWDLKTGDHLFTLSGHTDAVAALAVAQGKIISGSYDKTIKVWDLGTRTCLMTLTGHQDSIDTLTVYGRRIFSGSQDSTIKCWDLENGNCLMSLPGHLKLAIASCRIFNGLILTSSEENQLKIWDLETGSFIAALSENQNRISSIAFIGGKLIFGSDNDSTVKIWNFGSQKILAEIAGLLLSDSLDKSQALQKFLKLPNFIKHQIYEEYSKILESNKIAYSGNSKEAFQKNDLSTCALKALAIQHYLAKNAAKWLK